MSTSWAHRTLHDRLTRTGDDWPAVALRTQYNTFMSLLRLIIETPAAVEHVYPLWQTIIPELAAYATALIDTLVARDHDTYGEVKRAISLYHQLSSPYDEPNVTEGITWSSDKSSLYLLKLRRPRSRSAPVAKHTMLLDYMAYTEDYKGPSVRCPPLCHCVDCVGDQIAKLPKLISEKRKTLDEIRCTVGVGWMKPHSSSAPLIENKDDPLESYLAVPDILTNILSFKYRFGSEQDCMTNDFTIGLLKWLDNALELYCKYDPSISWLDFWKECYETVIMFLMSMEANNKLAVGLRACRLHFSEYPVEFFRHYLFPQILKKTGIDHREWSRIREIYLPDIDNFQFRQWLPQRESLWVPGQNYNVFKYNQFTLTGVTPVELWSEWCYGLWGQSSISEHEMTRYKLSKPNTFSFKCPYRKKLIEIIAFGVLKKKVHPQLIVDYLQALMLINMQPDLVFLARLWSPIAQNLYQRDFLENKYGLTDEEILSVHDFGSSVVS